MSHFLLPEDFQKSPELVELRLKRSSTTLVPELQARRFNSGSCWFTIAQFTQNGTEFDTFKHASKLGLSLTKTDVF